MSALHFSAMYGQAAVCGLLLSVKSHTLSTDNTSNSYSSSNAYAFNDKIHGFKSAKVDLLTYAGETSLLLATRYGQYECVEVLAKHGANVNAKDRVNTLTHKYAVFCTPPLSLSLTLSFVFFHYLSLPFFLSFLPSIMPSLSHIKHSLYSHLTYACKDSWLDGYGVVCFSGTREHYGSTHESRSQ